MKTRRPGAQHRGVRLRLHLWLLVSAAALSLIGCKSLLKKGEPAVEESDTGATPVVATESAIPSPQDFEEEAIEKVTAANFKSELARLKKEIAGK